jgi:putative sigma-54 modulation protein
MKIEMVCKNCIAGEKLREVIDKKISKLDKYFEDDTKCKIYMKKEGKSSKMEVSLEYKGNFITTYKIRRKCTEHFRL